MKIGKYKFNSKEQAETKIEGLGEEHKHTIVKLGFEKLTDAIIVDGEVTVDAVYSDAFLVDALWDNLESHPFGWKSYEIDIDSEGMHRFSGVSYLDNKI